MQENVNQNISPKRQKGSFTKGFIEQLELVVIFLAIIILVFSFVCKSCMVDGDSMLNTLHNQDRVVIWSLFYKPQYGDIVVIHDNGNLNKPIVKRVIGLPGDTVEVTHFAKGMQVTLTHSDGSIEVLEEDYIRYSLSDGHLSSYPSVKSWTVGEGEVFVMGDHRNNSEDSRSFGTIKEDSILGRVLIRFYPFDNFGKVE